MSKIGGARRSSNSLKRSLIASPMSNSDFKRDPMQIASHYLSNKDSGLKDVKKSFSSSMAAFDPKMKMSDLN